MSDPGEIGKSVVIGGTLGALTAQGERMVTPLVDQAIGNSVQRTTSNIAASTLSQSSVQAASNGLAARTFVSRLAGSTIFGAVVSTGIRERLQDLDSLLGSHMHRKEQLVCYATP